MLTGIVATIFPFDIENKFLSRMSNDDDIKSLEDRLQRTSISSRCKGGSGGNSNNKNWREKYDNGKNRNKKDDRRRWGSDSGSTLRRDKDISPYKSFGQENRSRHEDWSANRIKLNSSPGKFMYVLIEGIESEENAKDISLACNKDQNMLFQALDKMEWVNGQGRGSANLDVEVLKDKGAYSVVVKLERDLMWNQRRKIRELFRSHESEGFLEWLGGATGWRFQVPEQGRKLWKRQYVVKFNTLQSVFTLFAPEDQRFFFESEKKKMSWCKHDELTDIVSDIRVWIETLPESDLTKRLLRNSNAGPNAPVHWAHHHPKNRFPLTVVSDTSMMELVLGVVKLFKQNFGHTKEDPLGSRWRQHQKRRLSDWKDASNICPEWTEDRLEELLNRHNRWGLQK